MAKKFLTAKDVDLHADKGVTEIHVDDDLVITDLGQERARERGLRLIRRPAGEKSPPHPACKEETAQEDVYQQVRSAVIARLGSAPEGLEQILRQVINGK